MIIYHFHIHPQFIYESFHIHYIIERNVCTNIAKKAVLFKTSRGSSKTTNIALINY